MQAVSEHLFRRGKRGSLYLRRRIPNDVRDAYPSHKSEILLSLRTSDPAVAKLRLRAALSRLDDEFARRRVKLEERWRAPKLQQVTHLSTQHVQELADHWVRCVLETDEQTRREGLDDDDFHALGERITEQRAELGQLLARGQTSRILPAMRSFFHLSGIDARLPAEEEQQAAYTFLQAVVTALDYQGRRHSGQVVPTDEVSARASVGMTWQQIFETWRDYVVERPKPTTIACNTAWRQLEAFARSRDVIWPAHVTPKLMSGLVDDMRSKNLAPKTINERLRKIRSVYRIAVGKEVLDKNPCVTTLGIKVPKHLQGRNRRKSFSADDLQTIFGSSIFTQHVRSQGQSGEASYWIPLIMYYSGARPEEIAGLEVSDIRHHKTLGWYLHITDLPSGDDDGLFMDDTEEVDEAESDVERRHLKNNASRRNIPVARELIALGLLRYVDHVKQQGHARLFPTLQPDSHGKWSGAHGKFFGRYKKALGIVSRLKSLYSFRHGMKNYLERAKVPSKFLKRILGHTTGDGAVTDGYGSDLPLDIVAGYFAQIQFPPIPALPWEPGKGMVRWS